MKRAMTEPFTPLELALQNALREARKFIGATAPNPPVGAAALDAQGRILSVQAHQRAGTGHAEARVFQDLKERGLTAQARSLVVTLEPCNHHGRTPPCTEAILASPIRQVMFGLKDPNPRVAGHGAERLRAAGLNVSEATHPLLHTGCEQLIEPFAHWSHTGLPWVVVKTAHRANRLGSPLENMLPPPGQKTFTSPSSLRFAHELRKRADAIITGSGTVLADRPEFTVRHLDDHEIVASGHKKRILIVMDRRSRTPNEWLEAARSRGFEVSVAQELAATLRELGRRGVLKVLVEAGPILSSSILSLGFWNEHVVITQGETSDSTKNPEDRIEVKKNVHWHHPESRDGQPS